MKPELTQKITFEEFEECIKQGVEQAMKECELTIGMTLKEAVEKQIPKKPRLNDSDHSYFECDSCGTAIFYECEAEEHKYCLNCGQALDWGE